MPVLTVALACLAIGIPVLACARLRGNSGNVRDLLGSLVVVSSYLFASGVALSSLSGAIHVIDTHGLRMTHEGWLGVALNGALVGVLVYVSLRLLVYRLAVLTLRWTLRATHKEESLALQLRSTVWETGGFAMAFAMMFLIANYFEEKGHAHLWLLLPIFGAIIPFYETLVLPWLRFLGAPSLTERDLGDIEEWLKGISTRQKKPSFRIRVQEGDLANAYAIGGLFRHLIVIGGKLIDGMPANQLKAVLAHEIAHVFRRDVPRLLLPMSAVSGTCWLYCVWHFGSPLFNTNTVSGILAAAGVSGLSALVFMVVIPGYFMRRMEYRADLLAVELLGDGEVLADALRTLAALNGQPIRQGHWSHPSTLNRIRAIEESVRNESNPTTVNVAAAGRTDNRSCSA